MAIEDLKELVKQLLEEIRSMEVKIEEVSKPLEETSSALPMASASLEDVIHYTEQAVHQIMDALNQINENSQVIENDVEFLLRFSPVRSIQDRLEEIREKNRENINKLLEIYTLMSFQDLSSQQLKKVIESLENLKKSIIKLVASSIESMGLEKEQKERISGKVTELLTGDRVSQEDVDDLLKQLGL
jgi:chemotaxis protein CheZ